MTNYWRESIFSLGIYFRELLNHKICQVNFGKLLEMLLYECCICFTCTFQILNLLQTHVAFKYFMLQVFHIQIVMGARPSAKGSSAASRVPADGAHWGLIPIK
jgi:hypothetical protein